MAYRKLIVETVILYDDRNGKITPAKIKKSVETGYCQYEFGVGVSTVQFNYKVTAKEATDELVYMTKETPYKGILTDYLKD